MHWDSKLIMTGQVRFSHINMILYPIAEKYHCVLAESGHQKWVRLKYFDCWICIWSLWGFAVGRRGAGSLRARRRAPFRGGRPLGRCGLARPDPCVGAVRVFFWGGSHCNPIRLAVVDLRNDKLYMVLRGTERGVETAGGRIGFRTFVCAISRTFVGKDARW